MQKSICSVLAEVPVPFPKSWRGIEICENQTIAHLASAVLVAFEFPGTFPWTFIGPTHFYAYGATEIEEDFFGLPLASPDTPMNHLGVDFSARMVLGLVPVIHVDLKFYGLRESWPRERRTAFPRLVAGAGPRIPDGVDESALMELANAQKTGDAAIEQSVRKKIMLDDEELDWRFDHNADIDGIADKFAGKVRKLAQEYRTRYQKR